jgi:nucleoside-triphosphatase THEP1
MNGVGQPMASAPRLKTGMDPQAQPMPLPARIGSSTDMTSHPALPTSVDAVLELLAAENYVADRRLATSVFLALTLKRPLFVEGEPGVGKTELAKTLARALRTLLLRVQCYEGLDVAQTAYEWNVARQMMEIRLAEAAHEVSDAAARERLGKSLYARAMLIERPLLQALTQERSPVLLIDELDRADEPFDAFLLEVLAENQLTIPELGTVRADPGATPIVGHHEQPHARDPRCAEAALPVSLGRLPGRCTRDGHRAHPRSRRFREAVRAGRAFRAADAQPRSVQAARDCRDDRLDECARRTECDEPGARERPRHARRAPQAPRRHRKMQGGDVHKLLGELQALGRAAVDGPAALDAR